MFVCSENYCNQSVGRMPESLILYTHTHTHTHTFKAC